MDKYDVIRNNIKDNFDFHEAVLNLREKCMTSFLDYIKDKHNDPVSVLEGDNVVVEIREWVANDKHKGEYNRKYSDAYQGMTCKSCVFSLQYTGKDYMYCIVGNSSLKDKLDTKACGEFSDCFGELYDVLNKLDG